MNYKKFGIFLTLFVFFSCDRNVNEELIEYVIKNESDYEVQIISSPTRNTSFRETKSQITILKNNLFTEKRTWNERFDLNQGFANLLGTDSVNIIFGSERKIIYTQKREDGLNNCDDSKNILWTLPENGTNRVEYIFTNEDFDCAIICGNTCF